MKYTKWFNREICLDDIYFLYFPDKKNIIGEDELKSKYPDYYKARSMPGASGYVLAANLSPDKNPNVLTVTGRELLEIAGQNAYVPQFDVDFKTSKKLTLMKASAMDFFIEHSKIYNKR